MANADKKSALRTELKASLASFSDDDRRRMSDLLIGKLLADKQYQSANTILVYAAMPTEASLDPLIEAALADGKRVCVPMIDWERKSMAAAEIHNLDTDLVVGRYGVRTPVEGCLLVEPDDIDLILIPGLGFDRGMNRLGRGAGFYDRMIEAFSPPRPPLVGVCFETQIIAKVPTEAHDFPMDRVITENGFV